jgi:hypothetical protein
VLKLLHVYVHLIHWPLEEQFVDILVLEDDAAPEVDTQAVHQTGTQSVSEAGTPSASLADKLAEPSPPQAVLKLLHVHDHLFHWPLEQRHNMINPNNKYNSLHL